MISDDPDDLPHDGSAADALGVRQFLTLGGMFVGSVLAGLLAGLWLDQQLSTSPLLLVVGTAVGIVLAAAGFWVRVRSYLRG